MSIANEIRMRNRRMIGAVVANHFKVLVGDMDNEFFMPCFLGGHLSI